MGSDWGYEGKRVIVSGGGGSGMGAAVVEEVTALGAEVHVLDFKQPPVAVASHQEIDLTDPAAIAAAVEKIDGRIDALFNCVGVSGPPLFSDLETMLVNFVGVRHLTEVACERMEEGGAVASIVSAVGVGWEGMVETLLPLVETEGFEAAAAWCEANPEAIATGYGPSKKAAALWTAYACVELGERGIRINGTMPGPTRTPMLGEFDKKVGEGFWDSYPIPLGRSSQPVEQARPLVFLNSGAASCITGSLLMTDGGSITAAATGKITLPQVKLTFLEKG